MISLWPAPGQTVLDENGSVIPVNGITIPSLDAYYTPLVARCSLLTYDPLNGPTPPNVIGQDQPVLAVDTDTILATLRGYRDGAQAKTSGATVKGAGDGGTWIWLDASMATPGTDVLAPNPAVAGRWIRDSSAGGGSSLSYLIAVLATKGGVSGSVQVINGLSTSLDGAGGTFILLPTGSDSIDNIKFFASAVTGFLWKRSVFVGDHNIRWYGAHPSNSAHTNQLAIQAAINATSTLGVGLLVPAGLYVTDYLYLENNTNIYGEGFASIIKLGDGNQTDLFCTDLWWTGGVSNIRVSKLKLDGNSAGQIIGQTTDSSGNIVSGPNPNPCHLVACYTATNVTVEDCWFYDPYMDGAYAGYDTFTILDKRDGVRKTPTGPSKYITVRRNQGTSIGRNFMSGVHGTDVVVENNYGSDINWRVQVTPGVHRAAVVDLEPITTTAQLQRWRITGNRFTNCWAGGFHAFGRAATSIQDIVITDNVLSMHDFSYPTTPTPTHYPGHAFLLGWGDGAIVARNRVTLNNTSSGGGSGGQIGMSNTVYTENIVRQAGASGGQGMVLSASQSFSNVIVSKNQFRGFVDYAIYANLANSPLTALTVEDNIWEGNDLFNPDPFSSTNGLTGLVKGNNPKVNDPLLRTVPTTNYGARPILPSIGIGSYSLADATKAQYQANATMTTTVNAASSATVTATVVGARAGDSVSWPVFVPALPAGVTLSLTVPPYVSADDTITYTLANSNGSNFVPTNQLVSFVVKRFFLSSPWQTWLPNGGSAMAFNASVNITVTLVGLIAPDPVHGVIGDEVRVDFVPLQAGCKVTVTIPANDQALVSFKNSSGASITPTSGSLRVSARKLP